MANSVDPDQTGPIGAVCSGSTLFTSKLNSSVMLGIYLQQTTSADDIFRCIFFYFLALLGLSVCCSIIYMTVNLLYHFFQRWRYDEGQFYETLLVLQKQTRWTRVIQTS